MLGDCYGDGNRYRGVTSRTGKIRSIVCVGNAVLHDSAEESVPCNETQASTKTKET